ncbi:MAG: phosphate acyltransferase [Alistipes sp.]|nr:phosphate acyltransferase [Alistipes sp.]
MRIGIDAFGGDNAPEAVVKGAILALESLDAGSRIVLFGDRDSILEVLEREGCSAELFDIVHAPECIAMGDHPMESFRTKRNSSIVVGFNHLAAGQIDGFASAGSTGALMVGSMMVVKPLAGVLRPTIAIAIPTVTGGMVTILDIGINVDCRPEVLEQYGTIGSVYASQVLGQQSPRVALLNIGEERSKGNAQAKVAYELMEAAGKQGRYNFVGNIESSHIFTGEVADVVVCDGFVGNMVLKLVEGLFAITASQGAVTPFWQGLNYEQAGGTMVLGIGGVVTVGHGKSTPEAIKNMILSTERSVKSNLVDSLREEFLA